MPGQGCDRIASTSAGSICDLGHAVALDVLAHESVQQRLDVLGPLAQRRHADGHDVQSIEQVFAETPRLGFAGQVAVGRRHQPRVDVFRPPAHRLDLARLQRAQQLGLDGQRQLADLVDEQRAAVGLVEVARLGRLRAGEGAFDVTEELGLGELGGDGGRVEAYERLVGAPRVRVQRRRHHVLAGAARPGEQGR